MRILVFIGISYILNSLCYSQSNKGQFDEYTSAIKEQEQTLNTFDFSKYDPVVEKKAKENFNEFKAKMEKARSEDPVIQTEIAKNKAFRDKETATIEAWSKKIPQTIHSTRRVIEVK